MSKQIEEIEQIVLQDRDTGAYKGHLFFVEDIPKPLSLTAMVREILRRLNLSTFPDGSETKLSEGANVTITGTGTVADPYVINSAGDGGGDANLEAGTNVTITGTGTQADPYVINATGAEGGNFSHQAFTEGNFTAQLTRFGGGAAALANPAAGEYNFTLQAGSTLQGISIFGDNTTLNASQEMIVRINNAANSRNRRVVVQLYDANNGALVNQFTTGTAHTQSAAGNITAITIPGLNNFGATGYLIEIR